MRRFFLFILTLAILMPISAGVMMLFWGWIHRNFAHGIEPIGYTTSLQLSLWGSLLALMYGFGKGIAEEIFE